MSEFSTDLVSSCDWSIPPNQSLFDEQSAFNLPSEVLEILAVANGFITKGRIFRFFSTVGDERIPSISDWNKSEWKHAYGNFLNNVTFICEDIFGNQYGYFIEDGRAVFISFHCEGGSMDVLPNGINEIRQAIVAGIEAKLVDGMLVNEAFDHGMRPAHDEHLAFKLPLISGGEYTIDNLAVESVALHLGVLSQLSAENLKHGDQSPITGFTSNG